MIQIFLFLIAICFVITGIVLMARSLREPGEKKLSPQEEASLKINSFLSSGSEPASSNLLTNHILEENLKKQPLGEPPVEKKDDVARLEIEGHLRGAQERIEQLVKESEEIKVLLENHKDIQHRTEAELAAVRQSYEEFRNKEMEKLAEWEAEKQRLIDEANLLRTENANAVTLISENEKFRSQLTEIQVKINTLEANLKTADDHLQVIEKEKNDLAGLSGQFQQEKQQLLDEIKKTEGKYSQLQENFNFLKKSNEEKWNQVREESQELSSRVESFTHEKEMFEAQQQQLGQKITQLTQWNAQLLEKEKFFQRELLKARTRIIGLEEICIDFRSRIEETNNLREKVKV